MQGEGERERDNHFRGNPHQDDEHDDKDDDDNQEKYILGKTKTLRNFYSSQKKIMMIIPETIVTDKTVI